MQKKIFKISSGVIIIASLIIGSVLVYYFSNNNTVSITSGESSEGMVGEDSQTVVEASDELPEDVAKIPIVKKEFTEFGDFWIEVHTDNLDIKAPITGGVEKENLKRGVGHHKSTALPNEESGNIVLSGHRWLPGSNPANTVFRHLDKLSVGDKVSLFKDGKQYIYQVRESKTVSDDAVEILEQSDRPQLTIYTCTPLFTALKRLVYVADLVDVR